MELLRRVWHLVSGVVVFLIIELSLIPHSTMLYFLFALFVLVLIIEYYRFENSALNKLCVKLMKFAIRKKEIKKISGLPFFLLGVLFVTFVFPKPIAQLSILYLAIGDPAAGYFGRKYGHLSFKFNNGKSIIGFLASAFVCLISTFLYLTYSMPNFTISTIAVISLLGGLVGATSELISTFDDNSFIPMFSGLFLYLVFLVVL